uniref:Uncharacterized protein n=1 Tax=Picea glauca TaxID=3330 RepID=A0A101M234_PICGL|nr:hypothetical protein ABT39_MTgene2722 [Picea glauca]
MVLFPPWLCTPLSLPPTLFTLPLVRFNQHVLLQRGKPGLQPLLPFYVSSCSFQLSHSKPSIQTKHRSSNCLP